MRYQRDFEWTARRSPSGFRYGRDYGPGEGYRRPNAGPYDHAFSGRHYGGDYWWMGERGMPPQRYGGPYDEAYRRLSRNTHPRFSPVGGLQPAEGNGYDIRSRRHSRENSRFSDWTRWF